MYNKKNTQKVNIWFGFMLPTATFNNISVISWESVLLVTGNQSSQEKTTDLLPQVTEKHILFSEINISL
jgi:hypothetical protein